MLLLFILVVSCKLLEAGPIQPEQQPQSPTNPKFLTASLKSIEQLHEAQNSRIVQKGNIVGSMADSIRLKFGNPNSLKSSRSDSDLGKNEVLSTSDIQADADIVLDLDEVSLSNEDVLINGITEEAIVNSLVQCSNQNLTLDTDSNNNGDPKSLKECAILDNSPVITNATICVADKEIDTLKDNFGKSDQLDSELNNAVIAENVDNYQPVPVSPIDITHIHTESDKLSASVPTTNNDQTCQEDTTENCKSELHSVQPQPEDSCANVENLDCSTERIESRNGKQYPTLIERLGIAPLRNYSDEGPAETEKMLIEINSIQHRNTSQVEPFPEKAGSTASQADIKHQCCSKNSIQSNSIKEIANQDYGENAIPDRSIMQVFHSDNAVDVDNTSLPKKTVSKPQERSTKHFVPIIYVSSVAGSILILVACYLYYNRYRRLLKMAAITEVVITTPDDAEESEDSCDKPFSTVVQMQSPGKLSTSSNLKNNNFFTF